MEKSLSLRPAGVERVAQFAQVRPGLLFGVGAGGDPAVAQRRGAAQGDRGVPATDDGDGRGR